MLYRFAVGITSQASIEKGRSVEKIKIQLDLIFVNF
jgi:hypothetical protein